MNIYTSKGNKERRKITDNIGWVDNEGIYRNENYKYYLLDRLTAVYLFLENPSKMCVVTSYTNVFRHPC